MSKKMSKTEKVQKAAKALLDAAKEDEKAEVTNVAAYANGVVSVNHKCLVLPIQKPPKPLSPEELCGLLWESIAKSGRNEAPLVELHLVRDVFGRYKAQATYRTGFAP